MALDQYFDETISQIDSFTAGKSSLGKWNAISETDANGPGGFDCNICLDSVQDPVVTLCGHLYCWPCIYKWLDHFHSTPGEDLELQSPQCPVCKAEISQASLVPLYGRGQTTNTSKGKGHQIPRRPQGPAFGFNTQISTGHSSIHPPASQFLDHPSPYQAQPFNSVPSNYNTHFARPGVSMTNVFEPMIGVFGEMIYARVFDNAVTNVYTYPNTYNLSGISNPRIRRQVMQADVSLNRICFFLLCCILLCLLLF